MLQMNVKVVGLDQMSMVPVVVLTDDKEVNYVPIVIGPAEANAITVVIENIEVARPLSHDLMLTMIESLEAKVERVTITDIVDDVFYAKIYLNRDGKEIEIDARPSDSIALALRAAVPIYVSEKVVNQVSIEKPVDDPELEEFRSFLENLSPDDFRKDN